MIVPQGEGSTRYLVELEPGDLAQVRFVAFEFVRTEGWDLPIRPGEVLQLIEERSEGVIVARPDGSRIFVPQECARLIGVQKAGPHLESPGTRRRELLRNA